MLGDIMKIKHVKAAVITLDNGLELYAQYLGKGLFTTAWSVLDGVYLFVRSKPEGTDYSKDILITARKDLDYEEDNAKRLGKYHLPELEELGSLDKDDTRVFKSIQYEPLRASHKKAYAQFKILNKIYEETWRRVMIPGFGQNRTATGYDFNWHFLAEIEDKVDPELHAALRAVAEACENYGSGYIFEINKVNVGVNQFGTLILRDIIFDLEVLDRIRHNQTKRSQRRAYG